MLNRVVMQGGVVSEISPNQAHTAVRFRMGVNTGQKDVDGNNISHYFNVVCFQKQAEFALKHLKKGDSITVDGSVHDNNFVDSKGKKVYAKEIYASSLSYANGEQVNVVILTGRLTRDPETRYSTGSDPITVARYSIAVGKKPQKKVTRMRIFGGRDIWIMIPIIKEGCLIPNTRLHKEEGIMTAQDRRAVKNMVLLYI